MKLRAVRDTVLVKIIYADKIQSIIIPDKAKQYGGNFIGKVIDVGSDYKYDLKAGDTIHFTRHEGHKVICGMEEFISLREKWCVAKEVKK